MRQIRPSIMFPTSSTQVHSASFVGALLNKSLIYTPWLQNLIVGSEGVFTIAVWTQLKSFFETP